MQYILLKYLTKNIFTTLIYILKIENKYLFKKNQMIMLLKIIITY